MKRSISVASAIFCLILLSGLFSDANAQRPGMGPGRHWDKRAQNIENLRMLKLLELLDLNEDQSLQFIGMFVSFRKETRQINEKLQLEIESLADLLNLENPPEEEIKERISKIDELRVRREAAIKEFHDNISEMLTVVQMGKMVIFEERFERELIETVRCFRERHAPQPGP